jgi:hypothetical protein
MHFRTHVKPPELRGISGQDEYSDGMVEHDMHVGKLLKLLDELGIADDTLVFYSTDNGPHYNTWPDAAATPFRGEKNTNWEGGWRVPAMVRWPGSTAAPSVHFGETLHAARRGATDTTDQLLALAADTTQPGIARGTALEPLYNQAHPGDQLTVQRLLADDDALVRRVAEDLKARYPDDPEANALWEQATKASERPGRAQ